MMRFVLLIPLILAACAPNFAEKSYAALAIEVVRPIIDDNLTGAQSDQMARCIVDSATQDENMTLARDLGVMAGTSTEALVREVLARPETQACLMAANLPQPEV